MYFTNGSSCLRVQGKAYPIKPCPGSLLSFKLPRELAPFVHLHFSFLFMAHRCASALQILCLFVFTTKYASPEMPTWLPNSAHLDLCCLLGCPACCLSSPAQIMPQFPIIPGPFLGYHMGLFTNLFFSCLSLPTRLETQ